MSIVLNGTTGVTTPDLDSSDLTVTKAGTPIVADRTGSDGTILDLKKDGSAVGSIGTSGGDLTIGTGDTGLKFFDGGDSIFPVTQSSGNNRDSAVDLGYPSVRFKDLHLSGKTHSQIIGDGEAGLLFNSGTQDGVLPYNLTAGTLDARGTTDIGASGFKFKDLYLSGGVHLGGTGSANKLDDYEEGTFAITGTLTSGTVTFNSSYNTMSYTKIGRQVTVTGLIITSAVNSPSGLRIHIGSLPFTSTNLTEGAGSSGGGLSWYDGTNIVAKSWLIGEAQTNLAIYMDCTQLTAGDDFYLSCTYFTDD